ncbi:MAG: hypothetical protein HC902_09160 [Calothrix sp. SM1_5_4]|nr:hypothetical protein [Calothrix sp. SM1_5_4]
MRNARARLSNSDLNKQEQTEDLTLKALRLFWDAYVSQTQLQDAINARQQYKNLVGVVQRRGRFGLERGGEYAQVMADYTDADNAVKTASFRYIEQLKLLEVQMRSRFDEDIRFEAGDALPPIPRKEAVSVEACVALDRRGRH